MKMTEKELEAIAKKVLRKTLKYECEQGASVSLMAECGLYDKERDGLDIEKTEKRFYRVYRRVVKRVLQLLTASDDPA